MRIVAALVGALCLAGCTASSGFSGGNPEYVFGAHDRQVQRDVEAITQGMNYARAQSESVARTVNPPLSP